MDASDTNTAIREAHTVKGLAGNIGAAEMAKAAALVEGMLNRGETAGLVEALNAMERELAVLVGNIGQALGLEPRASAAPAPAAGLAADLEPELRRLVQLLEDSDSEASDVAEALEDRLKAAQAGPAVKDLMKKIGDFDFDAALVLAREVGRGLGLSL